MKIFYSHIIKFPGRLQHESFDPDPLIKYSFLFLRRFIIKLLQDIQGSEDFLNNVGAKKFEIDQVKFNRVFPLIPKGPFFTIPTGSHGK